MSILTRSLSLGSSFGIVSNPPSALKDGAFERHIAALLAPVGRFATSWAAIMILLFWPTDLLAFRRLPEALPAFAALRGALLASSLGCMVALRKRQEISPRVELLFAAPWFPACAALAYCLAMLGSLETPWFHFTYLCVALTIFFPVPPARRILYAVLIAAALVLGGWLRRPDMLRSTFFPTTLLFLSFVVIGSIAFGHLLFLLARSNFYQAQALQRAAAELSEQVANQTRELRQLAAHLGGVLEAERARISREVHDELGQELTALRYELSFARRRFEKEPASIGGNLANLEELLRRTLHSTRAIVTDLRPRILDDLGLCAAAEWLIERTIERTALPCSLRIEGREPVALADELAIATFRVLQESLTNATRHAEARRIEVVLRFLEESVELVVRDDGVGLTVSVEQDAGMGLVGMRERARALGGQLAVISEPGHGVEVRCRLPIVKASVS